MTSEYAEREKELGNDAFKVQEFGTALEHYSNAVDAFPQSHIYRSNRAAAWIACKYYDEAIADAAAAIAAKEDFAKAYVRLAACAGKGDLRGAAKALQLGLQKCRKDAQAMKVMRKRLSVIPSSFHDPTLAAAQRKADKQRSNAKQQKAKQQKSKQQQNVAVGAAPAKRRSNDPFGGMIVEHEEGKIDRIPHSNNGHEGGLKQEKMSIFMRERMELKAARELEIICEKLSSALTHHTSFEDEATGKHTVMENTVTPAMLVANDQNALTFLLNFFNTCNKLQDSGSITLENVLDLLHVHLRDNGSIARILFPDRVSGWAEDSYRSFIKELCQRASAAMHAAKV